MANAAPKDASSKTSGQAVVVLDRGFRVMGSNEAAAQILGRSLNPGDAFLVEDIFDGPSAAEAQTALDKVLNQGEASRGRQGRACGVGGQYFACAYSFNPLYGQTRQLAGVIFTLSDLDFDPLGDTLAEKAAALPHMPKLGYQALVESLAEGIFTINTRWRITSFNQTAEAITGYRREEVLGRFCWEIFRSEICDTGCPLKTTLESGLTRMDQDVRMLSKAGKRITVLCNTSVVKNRSDQVVGAVESFRPIGELDIGNGGSLHQGHSFSDIIGASPRIRQLFSMLPDVAASQSSVLLTGESGTGKELFARAIHHNSPRRQGPFMAVNCSALAETLLESELFGHEKAAFTGAVQSKVGRFELAKGGTLFLDEIGDLKPELQIKLLRVLEQRVFERVGGTRVITLDARIITATNRNLKEAMKEGAFREDLFYRLRTIPIDLPPLRERTGDIPLLVNHFIKKLNKETNKEVRSVDPKVMQLFNSYAWPGNIRELERVMEHAYVFVKGPVIFPANLPALEEMAENIPASPEESPEKTLSDDAHSQRSDIIQALKAADGKRQEAARILGISRTSLWRRMKSLGLA